MGRPDPDGPGDTDASRAARARGQQILDELGASLLTRPDVARGRMFGSMGLKVRGKLFAFVGMGGVLMLKLPAAHAERLVEAGQATRVTMGARAMRQWLELPLPTDDTERESWDRLLQDAYAYVDEITP